MNKTTPFFKFRQLLFLKIILTVFLFSNLIFFVDRVIAESLSPKANQWRSAGGVMVNSGDHKFKQSDPACCIKKASFTVRGPGYVGAFTRKIKSINPGVGLKYSIGGGPCGRAFMGNQDLLKGSDGNWKWYPPSMPDVFDPSTNRAGRIPGPTNVKPTISLDIMVGVEGGGLKDDPRAIEYEFWFFPLEGGKLISVVEYDEDGNEIDVTPGTGNCDALKKTLANYVFAQEVTLQSINDTDKQLDELSSHSKFNTGYLNEYQNNTLGDTPDWNKKNLDILQKGAGGGTASYLINKEKWKNQLNKSKNLQLVNLGKIVSEIAKVKREIQQQDCK